MLQVSRTVASQVLYDLRLESINLRRSGEPLAPPNPASYDALMVLYRSGSLAFDLEEVVREVVVHCSRGAIE